AGVAVLAALRIREREGVGSRIDLSLFDVALASMVNQTQSALLTGEAPRRLGSAHPSIVPYQSFQAADGALVLAIGNDGQFRRLCEALGVPELGTDERYATNSARVANRAELVPRLQALTGGRHRDELLAACSQAGVPATPVLTLPEALADPQAEARGAVVTSRHPTIGELPLIASPLWHVHPAGADGSLAPGRSPAAAPPLLGQHSRSVLAGDLGLGQDEIELLFAAGVVAEPSAGHDG
ncbi:MAG TPA: CaiB/BaiF CoA-transferase family protein, partial [Trueperaceae bacterium]|nr:CaiB/BaiF CoA-transferase family protein [Trueperaceae bacterium]